MNPNSLVVWKRVVESKFVLGLIIDYILECVSKTVHTLVMDCPRKRWTPKRVPRCSEDKRQKAQQAFVALMASLRRNRSPMPLQAGRGLEDEPKPAGGLETGCGVRVRPGFDHRFHSEVCEQDSTHSGDALPKEALDYQAVA